jgi:hypothetical protein
MMCRNRHAALQNEAWMTHMSDRSFASENTVARNNETGNDGNGND